MQNLDKRTRGIHSMAPIVIHHTPNPILQGLEAEIKANWELQDIAEALSPRQNPARNSKVAAPNAPDIVKWGQHFLMHLRDLSVLTKGKDAHMAVRESLGNRIDLRRHPNSSKVHTREQWSIVEDLQHLIKKYGARKHGI